MDIFDTVDLIVGIVVLAGAILFIGFLFLYALKEKWDEGAEARAEARKARQLEVRARCRAAKEAWGLVRFGGSLSAVWAALRGVDEAQRAEAEKNREVLAEQLESVRSKERKAQRAAVWTWWKTLRFGGSFSDARAAAHEAMEDAGDSAGVEVQEDPKEKKLTFPEAVRAEAWDAVEALAAATPNSAPLRSVGGESVPSEHRYRHPVLDQQAFHFSKPLNQ